MGVLYRHQRDFRLVVRRGLARPAHRSGLEHAVAVVELDELDTRIHRRRAVLVGHHMLAPPGDDGRPRPGEDTDRDLVRHDPRGNEKRRWLADPRREKLLERAHGRVLAVVVVSDLRLGHGASHGGRGTRHRVAAKVHHLSGAGGIAHALRLTVPH